MVGEIKYVQERGYPPVLLLNCSGSNSEDGANKSIVSCLLARALFVLERNNAGDHRQQWRRESRFSHNKDQQPDPDRCPPKTCC